MENMTNQCIRQVKARIDQAVLQSVKKETDITLVAVSKTQPIEAIEAAYKAGIRHFGENRSDELEQKATALKHLTDIQWHFIGHLQTRQSRVISANANYFHAMDRIKIAEKLSSQLVQVNRVLEVFIEVNISQEESKGGFCAGDWENDEQQRNVIHEAVEKISSLPNLRIKGLMTMAPWGASNETLRSIFRRLRHLSEWLNTNIDGIDATKLSMGMSGDFEVAIEEGATHVRVGSAIFGERR